MQDSLKKKAHIPVDHSYTLLGVADQTNLLNHGEVFVFVKASNSDVNPKPITGPVVVTKNPCSHPGGSHSPHFPVFIGLCAPIYFRCIALGP